MAVEALRDAALAVLRGNDLGESTKPAPRLYPHQWSWDSAFIAIGLASVDADRALRELESLFRAQWRDGRIPHIVFNPDAHDYFPGPERWASTELTDAAPRSPRTSGLIQPPVHALALEAIWEAADVGIRRRVEELLPRALQWHRYLATARDREGSGLISIYHPWESGTDNSPRWDEPLSRLEAGQTAPYTRHDLKHVVDPAERPTQAEYDRYLWLVDLLKEAGYDDARIHAAHPFLIKDMLMTAIFAAACTALARLIGSGGGDGGFSRDAARELEEWGRRSVGAVLGARSVDGLALDWDVRAAKPIDVRTCAGLAPLLLPSLPPDVLERTVSLLCGPWFAGAPGLLQPVVPSTSPGSPGFQARAYWRGPIWPVMNWLLWRGLRGHGQFEAASALRQANLALLSREEARFAEYLEPYTGEALGSVDQSWTAAVVLDWLAHPGRE
ncbi:MAG: glycogen debranching protein [Chloroflexota bacterium]|nr:glycogen debranching protein [Chloroflexota bacterium]